MLNWYLRNFKIIICNPSKIQASFFLNKPYTHLKEIDYLIFFLNIMLINIYI